MALSISTERELQVSGATTMPAFQIYDNIFRTCAQYGDPLAKRVSNVEYGFFAIDWTWNDEILKKSFQEWLNGQRHELKKRGVVKVPSRGGLRDQLRWLGALRVRDYYGRKFLVDSNFKRVKIDAPYRNLPDLYQNAKRAESIIGEWLKLLKEQLKTPKSR
jgi:hypothetical protein